MGALPVLRCIYERRGRRCVIGLKMPCCPRRKKRTYPEEKMLDWLTSNVPDKNVGDTIFRQDAIDAINHICPVDTEYDCTLLDRVDVRYVFSELPSAQLERKKGKWVGYDGDWFKTMCKCSECGAMIDINEKYKNFFCYHCGARMDGEQV